MGKLDDRGRMAKQDRGSVDRWEDRWVVGKLDDRGRVRRWDDRRRVDKLDDRGRVT